VTSLTRNKSTSTCWAAACRASPEWRDMTFKERKEYLALMARVEARGKGETVEVEATPGKEGEPTGEELPLDD
jgi:acyl-CoA reductase-like NAD-dependent aldehyde dehydrogenase